MALCYFSEYFKVFLCNTDVCVSYIIMIHCHTSLVIAMIWHNG